MRKPRTPEKSNLKKNLLNFGFQKQSGQLENTSNIKSAKKKNVLKKGFKENVPETF